MKTGKLRKAMLCSQDFLEHLQESSAKQNKKHLSLATDEELKTLLRVLSAIVNGHIPLKRSHHEKLVRSKREPQLQKLKAREDLIRMINADRLEKHKLLRQFSSLYGILLHPLFYK